MIVIIRRWLPSARLFRTTAFRLALIYATLFGLLSAATLGFIYWSTRDQIESQVDTRLRLETDYLINLYKSCLLYTSPSPRDQRGSRMPSSA